MTVILTLTNEKVPFKYLIEVMFQERLNEDVS